MDNTNLLVIEMQLNAAFASMGSCERLNAIRADLKDGGGKCNYE